jgi:aspartate aminotransferase
MSQRLAERIFNLSESQTIGMARLSRELQEQGKNVISLSLGEPDFITPAHIRESAKTAIDQGYTKYPPIAGFGDLREAITRKFERENNLKFTPEQIVVSTGAKQSIANVVLSLINPGDEVLVPSPYWVSYTQIIQLAEGKSVFIPSTVEADYKVTAQQVRDAITPRTRMFIFSSPCNPSGSVYTREELESIAGVLSEFPDIYVVSDEIYEHINFSGKHESIAQFNYLRDRVVVVNGVSKSFAMTGWRIGYIGAPKFIADACDKMQGQFTSAACSIAQKAALAALESDRSFHDLMRTTYRRRRDLVVNNLKEIPRLKVNNPMGAFYVFPDVSGYFGMSDGKTVIKNSSDLCMFLLADAGVSIVTGSAFGDDNCVRISYATSDELLMEALERIKTSLERLHLPNEN